MIELERGDRWVLPAAEGRLVGLLGDSAIVRQGDGSLWIASLAGGAPSRPLVDEACQGSVLAASAANESLLVRCHGSDPAQHSLRLYDPLGVRVLRADNTYDDRDAWRGGDHPRTLIWSHGPRLAIDLEAGHVRVVPTPAGARHLVEDDHHILHRVDQALSLTRITDGAQRRLAAEADEYPRYRQKGSIAAVDRVIVDLAAGELLGAVPTLPEALTAAGHALTPDPIPGRLVHVYDAVAVGPLRWRWPAPCEGKCPAGRFDR